MPLYLQRAVARLLFVGALLLNIYGLPPTAGLEWFVPVFFLKLIVSYLPKEAPYPAKIYLFHGSRTKRDGLCHAVGRSGASWHTDLVWVVSLAWCKLW